MQKADANRLRHMRDAAREAIDFARGRARSELDMDRMLVLALIKDVEIIGEVANQVSEDTRTQCQEVPWADIIGMRHRLVHAYFDINLETFGGRCNKTFRRCWQRWRRSWSANKRVVLLSPVVMAPGQLICKAAGWMQPRGGLKRVEPS